VDDNLFIFALAGLVGLALAAGAALQAWNAWLGFRRETLGSGRAPTSPAAARIELASLRERVRRLEVLASGIEL